MKCLLLFFLAASTCSLLASPGGATQATLQEMVEQLRPLQQPLGEAEATDWLAQHNEPGQTFAEYLAHPAKVTARRRRRTLYIQPIGEFSKSQQRAVTLTGEYMALYFQLKVRTLPAITIQQIPNRAKQRHPSWGDKQLLSSYLIYNMLKPKVPEDAAAVLGLTAYDLWPGAGWNFVFGQASTEHRVGVWSIYRNGNPDKSPQAFRAFLKRPIKTAVHETGHMFTLLHCTAYNCCMCGANNLEEADRRPLYLCAECMPKVCWATGSDPMAPLTALHAFCRKHGFQKEAKYFQQAMQAIL